MTTTLSLPSVPRVQMYDAKGNMHPVWQSFFRELYQRSGGANALSNTEISDLIGATSVSASRLLATDIAKKTVSVALLSAWIAGSTDMVTVQDDGDGTITLGLPDSITLNGATASRLLATDAGKNTVSADLIDLVSGGAGVTVSDDGNGGITLSAGGGNYAYVQTGDVNTGSSKIDLDNSVPDKTEGDEYMTLAYTPVSATSTLIIEVVARLSHSAADNISGALFKDSDTPALAAASEGLTPTSAEDATIRIKHHMVSGTTSEITFKFRAGAPVSGTTTFNGSASVRRFGGVSNSSMSVTEI